MSDTHSKGLAILIALLLLLLLFWKKLFGVTTSVAGVATPESATGAMAAAISNPYPDNSYQGPGLNPVTGASTVNEAPPTDVTAQPAVPAYEMGLFTHPLLARPELETINNAMVSPQIRYTV